MKRYRVVIPPIVQEQIRGQMFYIAQDSVDHALAWEDRLRAAVDGIGSMPGGQVVDEAASGRLGMSIHKLVFERTYLIHYVIHEKEGVIEVLNFRHGARLPGRGGLDLGGRLVNGIRGT